LLGPNGAGKSSLMRTIASLQQPDEGVIVFDGIDVVNQPNELRKRLGYLPQDFGVYPRVSAEALLDHLAILKGIENKAQRKETLIIVDEPTAGLDPEERNRFHNLLVSLGQDKVIILSTHIVDDVSELCEDMAVLGEGQILLQGNPIEVTESLKGRIWRKIVQPYELDEIEGQIDILSTRLFAGRTVVHVVADTPPDGFEAAPASLEDVYFNTLAKARSPLAQQVA